jgi:hypothetical protein
VAEEEGEPVQAGEPLLSLETDKVNLEVSAERSESWRTSSVLPARRTYRGYPGHDCRGPRLGEKSRSPLRTLRNKDQA